MTVAANKRSVMMLFSSSTDIYSHQVRIALAEKGVNIEIELVTDKNNPPQDLIDLNPDCNLPTLIDRGLMLDDAWTIMEYLDERFPHPPLMPVYPVARAQSRSLMYKIRRDWYPLLAKIEKCNNAQGSTEYKQLYEELELLTAPSPLFKPYCMSEDFTFVDCHLAPMLLRLCGLGITFTGQLENYRKQLFGREPFKASLTEAEHEMLPKDERF